MRYFDFADIEYFEELGRTRRYIGTYRHQASRAALRPLWQVLISLHSLSCRMFLHVFQGPFANLLTRDSLRSLEQFSTTRRSEQSRESRENPLDAEAILLDPSPYSLCRLVVDDPARLRVGHRIPSAVQRRGATAPPFDQSKDTRTENPRRERKRVHRARCGRAIHAIRTTCGATCDTVPRTRDEAHFDDE